MEMLANNTGIILFLVLGFGLFMAWGIGANDVANAMGTSVGSGALTLKQAIIIAAIFEFLGAFLAGGEVTSTIRKGIIDPAVFEAIPDKFVLGMLSALLAAATWLLIASHRGWPVSTTHSIVGAIVGFSAVVVSVDAVNWSKVGEISASWVVSPLLAGSIAWLLYKSVDALVLTADDARASAARWVPLYMWMVGFMISMVTFLKGLKHVGFDVDLGTGSPFIDAAILAASIGLLVAIAGGVFVRRQLASNDNLGIEGIFGILMIFTACGMAFAHGSNDVANAIGPVAAVVQTVQDGGNIAAKSGMPWWVLLIGGLGIVVGLATYGWRVISTIGSKITELTPSRGFAAELGAAGTVVIASGTGLPISTTHTLVGAVLGVGLARGTGTVDFQTIKQIVSSWLVTLPVAAVLAICFYYMLNALLG
ncbi:MAG: phosphate permease [Alteromonadaceae bacterium]|jgi:PiT family inorganic phosphate transporter|nr:phosphate permease [Alteromonadaceae bacterium]RPH08571.1 MAG: inorganic phosphate transporter [Alteromonadaceae bacterium TMED101]HBQ03283.1 phosphate permease [Halieaceae bacterium]HCJ39237.1 phosphate permease [Halieaceae bacterium]